MTIIQSNSPGYNSAYFLKQRNENNSSGEYKSEVVNIEDENILQNIFNATQNDEFEEQSIDMDFCYKNIRACLICYAHKPEIVRHWINEILISNLQHIDVAMDRFQPIKSDKYNSKSILPVKNFVNMLAVLDVLSAKNDIKTLNLSLALKEPNYSEFSTKYYYFCEGDDEKQVNIDSDDESIIIPVKDVESSIKAYYSNSGDEIKQVSADSDDESILLNADILINKIELIINNNKEIKKISLSLLNCDIDNNKFKKLILFLPFEKVVKLDLRDNKINEDYIKEVAREWDKIVETGEFSLN